MKNEIKDIQIFNGSRPPHGDSNVGRVANLFLEQKWAFRFSCHLGLQTLRDEEKNYTLASSTSATKKNLIKMYI